MKKVALALAFLGATLAILAQYAIDNDWTWYGVFHTLGFIGYIFVISAVAYFSLVLIHHLSRNEKIRIRRFYHRNQSNPEV
jgi:peptidoglycan/LPS O-acetylase OafA/YrhL